MKSFEPIRPLFNLSNNPENMGKGIIEFTCDDYNKELRAALISCSGLHL